MEKFVLFALLVFGLSYSQAPDVAWMQKYGGDGPDICGQTIPTQDGGYLIGGKTRSGVSGIKTEALKGFNSDYWVVKLDGNGVVQWQKDLGGGGTWAFTELTGEQFTSLAQATDGSYYVCGYSDSPILGDKSEGCYGSDDYWIVKLSSTGTILWDKTIGGSSADRCYTIDATPDGGCIVGGQSFSGISGNKTEGSRGSWDYWVVKLSASGTLDWQRTLGGSNGDTCFSLVTNSDGSCVVGGISSSGISGEKTEDTKGGADYWVLKLDSGGAIAWQKTIGSQGNDEFYEIAKAGNEYLLCGQSAAAASFDKSENSKGGVDFWVVRIDGSGNILWDKTIGGADGDYLLGASAIPSGGFVLTGDTYSGISGDKTESNYGGLDGWVVRIDANGAVLWDKDFGTEADEGFNHALVTLDGSILLGGVFNSNLSGNITVNGYGGFEYCLIKLQPENLGTASFNCATVNMYPNPTTNFINISSTEVIQLIQLSDMQGRVLQTIKANKPVLQMDFILPKRNLPYKYND